MSKIDTDLRILDKGGWSFRVNERYDRALEFARKAHEGQVYGKFTGEDEPYINHPVRVAGRVDGTSRKVVALLHDVVEDTEVTDQDLAGLDFLEPVERAAVMVLTRREHEAYSSYIKNIRMEHGNKGHIARDVKTADLVENLSYNPPENLREKYRLSLYLLNSPDLRAYRQLREVVDAWDAGDPSYEIEDARDLLNNMEGLWEKRLADFQ